MFHLFRKSVILTLSTLALASYPAFGQGDTTRVLRLKNLVALPVVIHSPETKWGIGMGGAFTFRLRQSDSLTRTSNLQMLGLRTTRGQTIIGLDGTLYFPHENYILRLHSSYSFFPDKYWGLGNRTDHRKPETFSYRQFYFFPQLLRRVYKDWYVGVSLEFQQVFHFSYDRSNFYDYYRIVGLGGGVIPGAGMIVTWDSRNNAFSPTSGTFFESSFTTFENHHRKYDYSNFVFDLRKYFSIPSNGVIALQAYGNLNNGSIPILSLASLGGSTIMRGYYSGRFRDNNLVAAQMEFRKAIYKRIGIAAFAALGQVTHNMEDIGVNQFKLAAGAGLRFALKPKERLNLRMDYGRARNSQGFYLTVAEAF